VEVNLLNFIKEDFHFYDIVQKKASKEISTLFPDWGDKEAVAVFCPHDDDGLLGAGYAWLAAKVYGADTYIAIFCNGSCGYSRPEERDDIIQRRISESSSAYNYLGVSKDHIKRFNVEDFCLGSYKEWKLPGGYKGVLEEVIRFLREKKVTRILVPNDYREHPDHYAASYIASYLGPQAGDNIVADWGVPSRVKTYLKYSVWSRFSPEEPANRSVKVTWRVEEAIRESVAKFESQKLVIQDLYRMRDERRIDDYAIEVYTLYDPRPKLDFQIYKDAVIEIDGGT
jgi:LmbE family N-acetylglucosaminyl deacetylase